MKEELFLSDVDRSFPDEWVTDLEKELGAPLPKDYVALLQLYNGGRPNHWSAGRMNVLGFFKFSGADTESLDYQREDCEVLPPGVLPIARCSIMDHDSRLCLELATGRVYTWRYTSRKGVTIARDMTLVAESFTKFLQMLTGGEEGELASSERIADLGRGQNLEALDIYLRAGGDINAVTSSGESSYWFSPDVDFIEQCMARGARVPVGRLGSALVTEDEDLVVFLLKHGADPNEVDEYGDRPLDRITPQHSLYKMMVRAGAVKSGEEIPARKKPTGKQAAAKKSAGKKPTAAKKAAAKKPAAKQAAAKKSAEKKATKSKAKAEKPRSGKKR